MNLVLLQFETEHLMLYWMVSLWLSQVKPNKDLIQTVLFNQCVVTPLLIVSLDVMPAYNRVLGIYQVIGTIVFYSLMHCIWFYTTHRIMHTRWLWHHVHKIHHEYKITHAFCAFYCHWFEHACVNLLSVFLGPILFPSNCLVLKFWLHLSTIMALYFHSGDSRTVGIEHDIHHTLVKYNYGTLGAMDWLFGTSKKIVK